MIPTNQPTPNSEIPDDDLQLDALLTEAVWPEADSAVISRLQDAVSSALSESTQLNELPATAISPATLTALG
jgi:hypothetical protein